MAGNSFGSIFRLTTFGESHGPVIGGVVDGCPSNVAIDTDRIQQEVDRRKPGASFMVSARKEEDRVEFLSGIFEGKTTGAPIAFIIRNSDSNPSDYAFLKQSFRPSHADYTYYIKYGIRDHRGGGRASARETAARVVAGAIARIILEEVGMKIIACTSAIGKVSVDISNTKLDPEAINSNSLRCPDSEVYQEMAAYVESIKKSGDTIGSEVCCKIFNPPARLGEPVFDKLSADLAKAMLSINGANGFEIGSGFRSIALKGSEHNDPMTGSKKQDEFPGFKAEFSSNHSGGINGGITNGQDIFFRVSFKPVPTLHLPQQSITVDGEPVTLTGQGRHDTCIAPRAVAVVEAMACLVMADHLLRFRSYKK
jgi:chorismate synthase